MSTAPLSPTSTTPADLTVEDALRVLGRNPVVAPVDRTGEPAARRWAAHRQDAETIAAGRELGSMFATIQRRARGGFWVTEWTVTGRGEVRSVLRRRAGRGATLREAVADIMRHASYPSSHYFAPEEGLLGWLRRP